MKTKANNYIFNKTIGRYHFELVMPSYKAFNSDMGYYWDLGISVSVDKASNFSIHIGLIIGWFRFTKYEN